MITQLQDVQQTENLTNQIIALNAQLGENMSMHINLRASFVALQKENQRLTQELAELKKPIEAPVSHPGVAEALN